MSKQDGYAPRTAADLERKYNFGQTFAEVYGLVRDAQTAAKEAQTAVEELDSEAIFNCLTNYGEWQGIYRGDDGGVYINASFIKSGTIKAGLVEVEAASITGQLVATQIDAKDLKVFAANITGTLTAGQIDATNLEVSAANITGQLKANQIDATDLWVDAAHIDGQIAFSKLDYNTQSAVSSSATKVNAWTYADGTTINGNMIATGTVKASYLLGGTVGLLGYLNGQETTVGQMTMSASASAAYAVELQSTQGGLRMYAAGGAVNATAKSGSFMTLGYDETGLIPICQFGGGAFVLDPGKNMGATFPGNPVYGQVFFKTS